jgi:hypothetical protein
VPVAAVLARGSQLLGKSLAMTGEIIDARLAWQGCLASPWFRYKDEDVLTDRYKPPGAATVGSDKEVEMKNVSK